MASPPSSQHRRPLFPAPHFPLTHFPHHGLPPLPISDSAFEYLASSSRWPAADSIPRAEPALPPQAYTSPSSFGYLFDDHTARAHNRTFYTPQHSTASSSLPSLAPDTYFTQLPTPPWLRFPHQHAAGPSFTPAPPMPTVSPSDSRKRSHRQLNDDEEAKAKRRRQGASSAHTHDVEEVDLASCDNVAQALLKKEREELVTSQKPNDESAPKSFADMTCIICMDNYTDLTATPCGHIFCHECLTQALMAGERSERGAGSCPVCRKALRRTTKNHVIPLNLMTKTKYKQSMGRIGL